MVEKTKGAEKAMKNPASRSEILRAVQMALAPFASSPLEVPPEARFAPRQAKGRGEEAALLLKEVGLLSGKGRLIRSQQEFTAALAMVVEEEGIRKAAVSPHPLLEPYGLEQGLKELGVALLPPAASARELADCDLGVTVADAALPETGTIVLRTTLSQPDLLSLLPRVHLAVVSSENLLADLHHAFSLVKGDRHAVLVSGSSRTADIEKVLTLGVHGPKSFHLWCLEGQ